MMASKLLQILSLLLLSSLGLGSVLYKPDTGAVSPATLFARQEEDLPDPASCTTRCESRTCGSSFCSAGVRSLEQRAPENIFRRNVTEFMTPDRLDKRVFSYTPGGDTFVNRPPTAEEAGDYLVAIWNGQDDGYYGGWLPVVHHSGDERAMSQQVELGSQPFQILSPGLHGCTTVILVSQRAVWMAHFWESYSNGAWSNANGARYQGAFHDGAFYDRVIRFMRGMRVRRAAPSNYAPYITPEGPFIDGSLFNDRQSDRTHLFIMTPAAEDEPAGSEDYEYGGRKNEIVDAVRAVLGDGVEPRVTVYGYQPLDYPEDEHGVIIDGARGIALFQYDPDADGNGRSAWRVFLEDRWYSSLQDGS